MYVVLKSLFIIENNNVFNCFLNCGFAVVVYVRGI